MNYEFDKNKINRALEVLTEYLNAPGEDNDKLIEDEKKIDSKRISVINDILKPLINDFFNNKISIIDFKSKIDSTNKQNNLWGFRGIKGQMFFNMIVNIADDLEECEQEIKSAISLPENDTNAKSKIKNLQSYVKRIGEDFVESGGSNYKKPRIKSIPFFLSYFWQIQDNTIWPVYYTNSVNVMEDLNLFLKVDDLASNYITFKEINYKLSKIFSEKSNAEFSLYEVEHVFWFKGGNIFLSDENKSENISAEVTQQDFKLARLPDSYIPPVVFVLPLIAKGSDEITKIAKDSGTHLPTAFEKYIDIAFSILGYETKRLGQGSGRNPDGIAYNYDDSYAIIWDAKVRQNDYSIGTDDRTIKEYIGVHSRELKKRKSFRNIYYLIISSNFKEDFDDAICNLKMDTDVNEIILLEVDALVEMVNIKLRDPIQVSLGPDGIQRLFTLSGILNKQRVQELSI